MGTETLEDQYNTVKTETTKSHVLQFGDLTFTSEPIGNFESGNDSTNTPKFWSQFKRIGKNVLKDVTNWEEAASTRKNEFAVDSRDINLHYLYNMVMSDPTIENNEALQAELNHRMTVDLQFAKMFPTHVDAVKNNTTPLPTDFECYRRLISTYEMECGAISDYSLKYMKYFVAECEGMKSFPSAIDGTIHRMKSQCSAENSTA
jgi:legumain